MHVDLCIYAWNTCYAPDVSPKIYYFIMHYLFYLNTFEDNEHLQRESVLVSCVRVYMLMPEGTMAPKEEEFQTLKLQLHI